MPTYIISYDLNKPGQDYAGLYDALKTEKSWWHHLDSTWCVVSDKTAAQLRDKLQAKMDANDALLVVKSAGEAGWFGFNQKGSNWLRDNL